MILYTVDMTEADEPKSLEEQMAECPIHQWTNVDNYLERAKVPKHLYEPFHKLLLARGRLPTHMADEQGKMFGSQAVEITHQYEMTPVEGHALKMIFGDLIRQWIEYRDSLQ